MCGSRGVKSFWSPCPPIHHEAGRRDVGAFDEPLRPFVMFVDPGNAGATDRVVSLRAATISEFQESEP